MDHLQRLQTAVLRDPQQHRTLLLTGAAAAVAVVGYGLAWSVRDYRDYMALGKTGTPHNVFGWAAVNIFIRPLTLGRRGALSTRDYPREGAHEDIKALPARRGERPDMLGVVPHRQQSQLPPESLRQPIQNLFTNAVAQNPILLETKRSWYETHHDGLFVSESLLRDAVSAKNLKSADSSKLPRAATRSHGEIGHVHEELSVHLYVTPADARLLIEKGWAERHRLSLPRRSWFSAVVPVDESYLMFYGPRDEHEMRVLQVILRNSIRFMTGREDIADFDWKTRASS